MPRGVLKIWPALVMVLLTVVACAARERLDAVPFAEQSNATIPGLPNVRYWADGETTDFVRDALDSLHREESLFMRAGNRGPLPPAEFLAISGGGADGAFGAGLLVGWTAAGTRPQFKAVTGISTGALIAPFAFLGPDYDDKLKGVYTLVSSKDIYKERNILAGLTADALSDTGPLRELVRRMVDRQMLDAIAAEHEKGRMLFIGTTNLDARRPVIWNVGKIAASRDPRALPLLHELLVASAAIPGMFPPVMIDVDVDGRRYEEMHVDGGATAQVFVYPSSLDIRAVERREGRRRERRLYVLRNARLDPDWAQVQRRTLSIANRAVTSLIQTQGIGDLYRIYLSAQRDAIDFNLAFIPDTFKITSQETFDPYYMRRLFAVGYGMAAGGYPWAKTPPGFPTPHAEPPLSTEAAESPKTAPSF